MINEEKTPTELLMDALTDVEDAKNVVIIIDKGDSINVRSNCDYKETVWQLDQTRHATMCELFALLPKTREDD